jgi:F0F1-type ATP synthase assembly protein I
MDDQPGLSDQYRMSSPWPLIVVLGLVFSELGLLFNVFAVAVGGLLLFVGAIAGIVLESGYAERPWNLLAGLGVVLCVLGALVTASQLDSVTLEAVAGVIGQPSGVVARGVELLIAGIVAVLIGAGGRFAEIESI